MARSRRRHSDAQRPVLTFDEQLWPVCLALLGLAGMAGGVIASLGDFEHPLWWRNARTYLITLGLVTLALMIVAGQLDRRRFRRGVLLAALLSLLVHIGLVAALRQQHLQFALHPPRTDATSQTSEEFVAPDFHITGPDAEPLEHERPIATRLPDELLTELEQSPTERPDALPVEGEPTPEPGDQPEVPPEAIPLAEREEAAPRLADMSSELSSRTPSEAQLPPLPSEQPAEPLAVPQENAQPESAVDVARAAQLPAIPPETSEPVESANVEAAPNPLERSASDAPAPALPSISQSPESLANRTQRPPQVSAPQVSQVPLPGAGVDLPVLEPVPEVRAPARAGTGVEVELEVGAAPDPQAPPVALGPVDTRRAAPAVDALPKPAADLATRVPGRQSVPRIAPPRVALPEPAESSPAEREPSLADTPPPTASLPARSTASLPVRVTAPESVGGLGPRVTPEVGTPSRRAQEESQIVHSGNARLLGRKTGGPLAIDGRTREPAEAFARRGGQPQSPVPAGDQPSPRTEVAIELGLEYLVRQQAADGHWSLSQATLGARAPDPPPAFRSDTAATGLALLSFLGAGYDHYGGRYAQVVERALRHLVRHQRPNGDLYQPQDAESDKNAWLYSHGIAAIALCEAYGMTGDRELAGPAQKAIDFIVSAQDPARGAWRYAPQIGSDTSVSGWQIMALKSGELAGLNVSPSAYERVKLWLARAQTDDTQFVYNPFAPDTPQQRHGRRPSSAMTAVGLLMRMYTGWNRTDPRMVAGAEHLLTRLPERGTAAQPARDTYYWYYATQVMFHMRGKYWHAWNERLHPLLIDEQIQTGPLAGSWDPRLPVPDRWGPQAGRLYVTTLNLLSLEVFYRHLPIYESTAQ